MWIVICCGGTAVGKSPRDSLFSANGEANMRGATAERPSVRDLHAANGSEAQLRQVLETLPAAAYTCDHDGLITYFNQRSVELWGRAPRLNDPADRFCGSIRLFSPAG